MRVIETNEAESDHELYREPCPNICKNVSKSAKNCCSFQTLKKRLPILGWLPHYDKETLIYDAVAGLTVSLVLIPQGIAFAIIAGLPPHYGLYSAFMGSFVYTVFGSCKDMTVGPNAIMALMTYTPVHDLGADFAFLGTFLVGCIIFAFGILNLGFLVQFISEPTIAGFIAAGVVVIGSSQLKLLLGIESGGSNNFVTVWKNLFLYYHEIKLLDTALGLISLMLLIYMKDMKCLNRWPALKRYVSISRNAIMMILSMIIAYLLHLYATVQFQLAGTVAEGLPEFKIPPFETVKDGVAYDFFDMARALSLWLVMLSMIVTIESIAIAKAFSKGRVVDATQEMIALGLCNIGSSFFRSMPLAGALLRSAINHNSGVRTTFGGVITGCIVLLALGILSRTFYFIPKTILAAVMIAALTSMLNTEEIIRIYRTKRTDFTVFLVTFFFSLWKGLDFGVLAGIVVNIIMLIYSSSRPSITFTVEKVAEMDILVITPDRSLNYSSAEFFKSIVIEKVSTEFSKVQYILINGASMNKTLDITAAKNVISLIEDLETLDKQLYFWNWEKEAFHLVMRNRRDLHNSFRFGSDLREIVATFNEQSGQLRVVNSNGN